MAAALDLTISKEKNMMEGVLSGGATWKLPSQSPARLEQRKNLTCHQCEYSTDRSSNLKRHLNSVHLSGDCVLTCCGKSFQSKTDLRVHSLSAHKGLFKCHECRKSFSQRNILERHIQSHRDSSFRCRECTYETCNKSSFEDHVHFHLGEDRRQLEANCQRLTTPMRYYMSRQHHESDNLPAVTLPSTSKRAHDHNDLSLHLYMVNATPTMLSGGTCETASPPPAKYYRLKSDSMTPPLGSISDASYDSDDSFDDLPEMEVVSPPSPEEKELIKSMKKAMTPFDEAYKHKKLRISERRSSHTQCN